MIRSLVALLFIVCQSISSTINTTFTSEDCSYYSGLHQLTTPANKIFDTITFDSTVKIQFNIKLHQYCSSICNILFFTNSHKTQYLDLSIDGIENYFEISTQNSCSKRTLSNANHLLIVDNMVHIIALLISDTELVFQIQNTSHIYHIGSMQDTDTYSLYFSNPWKSAINALVSNICVDTLHSPTIGLNVQCGDKLIGELLSYDDIEILTFTLPFFANVVLFDTCGSNYDTALFFYTNYSFTHYSDDDGHCGYQAQLVIPNLVPDEYHLLVSGYGDIGNHDYGIWHLDIICRNNEQLVGINEVVVCNDSISETLVLSVGSNYYHLKPANESESILIDTCRSSYDTEMVLYDMNFTHISDLSECLLFASTKSDEYILGVYAASNVQQFPHQLYLNTLCIQNTSVANTTTSDCISSLNGTYSTTDIQPIVINIHPNIEIKFELKINEYCTSLCNVLFITNVSSTEYMIISLEGNKNELQILTKSYHVIDNYTIANINPLLPVDGEFHSVIVSINELTIKVIIENESYFHRFPFTFGSNFHVSTVYFSDDEHVLNATISSICINEATLNSFIQCGDKLNGELLAVNSTENFIFVLPFDADLVLIDSCGTFFDSVLIMFNIWDGSLIAWNDHRYCGVNAQLLINDIAADWYYLVIQAHSIPLKYYLHIICSNSEQLIGTDGDIRCGTDIDITSSQNLDFFYFHMYMSPMTWSMTIIEANIIES